MANRLEPLNLMSFVGGLNLRRNQFQLAEDESPDLLNVDIDPRGGFYTRRGWFRWNVDDIVDMETIEWEPRNAFMHVSSQGAQVVFVVNNGIIYRAEDDAEFAATTLTSVSASPHGADFAAWGDDVYVACGMFDNSARINLVGTVTTLDPDNWSEVDAPVSNTMPPFEYVEAHGGYLFGAVTVEAAQNRYHRVRWSHPGDPDSWREDDFIDIEKGGGRITGLMSFQDHLLIFKTNSVFALYGYDQDSWQLIEVSTSIGCPAITGVTRSETAVYFFSASDRGGIYGYSGNKPVYLSEKLRVAFEDILVFDNVFVSWAGRRLWVAVPWTSTVGGTQDPTTTFVYDPDIGEGGAWVQYRSEYGSIATVLDGSDVQQKYPIAAFWSETTACMLLLDVIDDAYDAILEAPALGALPDAYIVTGLDEEIAIEGEDFVGQDFDSYYRTRWLHAGWPDRKKSWRRPTFVCREVPRTTDLLIESFRDYNETTVHRTRTLRVQSQGASYWSEDGFAGGEGGFDWTEGGAADVTGTGADWGAEFKGSKIMRGGSLGLARAMQLRVRASPTTPKQRWGVDGIVAKIVMRRFR